MDVHALGTGFLRAASAAVEAAIQHAGDQGLAVAVVVVDASFTVAFAARMDGAYSSTYRVAQAKAHTALNFRAATEEMAARVRLENQQALQRVEPLLMFVGGGVPLRRDGAVIGAVGVSGGSEEADIDCARRAAKAAEQAWAEAP